jgi:hypothetical protein
VQVTQRQQLAAGATEEPSAGVPQEHQRRHPKAAPLVEAGPQSRHLPCRVTLGSRQPAAPVSKRRGAVQSGEA